MFQANFKNSYNKVDVNGEMRTTYVYSLSGSDKAIAAYKTNQKEFYRTDETPTNAIGDVNPHFGKPLYFSQVPLGKTCTLELTATGRLVLSADEAMDNAMATQKEVAVRMALEAQKAIASNSKLAKAKTVVLTPEVEDTVGQPTV